MSELAGNWKSPKSAILKLNKSGQIQLDDLNTQTLKMALVRPEANIDFSTISTFTGSILDHELNYSGYSRPTLSGVARVNNLSDRYVWTANNVTFNGLMGSVKYVVIFEDANKHIISILDLDETYSFAGNITFNLSVYGFLSVKV